RQRPALLSPPDQLAGKAPSGSLAVADPRQRQPPGRRFLDVLESPGRSTEPMLQSDDRVGARNSVVCVDLQVRPRSHGAPIMAAEPSAALSGVLPGGRG